MNWVEIGAISGIFSLILTSIVTFFIYKGYKTLQIPQEIDTTEVVKELFRTEQPRLDQLKSVDARISNEANKRISRNLLENSPLKTVLNFLDEETIQYLEEHPDALPGVINKWLPIIKSAKPLLDLIIQKVDDAPTEKFDF